MAYRTPRQVTQIWLSYSILAVLLMVLFLRLSTPPTLGIIRNKAEDNLSLIVNKKSPNDPTQWWLASIDNELVKQLLWSKIKEHYNLPPQLAPPKISLAQQNNYYPAFGVYSQNKNSIIIYEISIYDRMARLRNFTPPFDLTKECQTLLYIVIGHELLHYAYNQIGIDLWQQHEKMCSEGILSAMTESISQKLSSAGMARYEKEKYCRELPAR